MSDQGRLDRFARAIVLTLIAASAVACNADSTTPTTPTAIVVSTGGGQTGVVNTPLAAPVIIQVTTANGAPLGGEVVTFTPSVSSGSVSEPQTITDDTGLAGVIWTLGKVAGADSLTATAGSVKTVIVATATAGPAANLTIVSGNNQTASVGSALSSALSAKATDAFGNPVANAPVQWTSDAGGTFSTTTTITDVMGLTSVNYRLGPTAGANHITAAILANGTPVTTSFTEVAN